MLSGKAMAFVWHKNRRKAIYSLILVKYVLLNILPGILSIVLFHNHQITIITTKGKRKVNAISYYYS